ncbi:MAG: Sodium-dependent dicarboxylate transporter SdcS [Candidatus Thorarchaeota archaeon AB_25]|nr:MAG: Sodium-dependent dicarboxylate transporter SdcS [Candidatus Thorarchaeota archaeon AB_25]
MHYKFSRKTAVILIITVIAGLVVYNIAPTEIEPGQYMIHLEIQSSSIDASQVYNISFVSDDLDDSIVQILNGTSTNVTVTIPQYVVITPDNPLRITLDAVGDSLSAEEIVVTLTNVYDFNLTLRPNRQSGQTFIIEYQPLVNSRSAMTILTIVAILWFSEGISLVATSLLIPILIVLTDIRTPQTALAPFFDPAVALIFGGFLIGRALTKYELDKRLALLILSKGEGSGSSLILTVMGVTAFLSMWISNTASAAIMIPIALAVISRIRSVDVRDKYGKALVLGVAYSATLGGVASIVGSPPNPLAATYINSFLGIQFSFMSWIPFGLPVVLIMLPLVWRWLIFRFKLPKGIEEMNELKEISYKEYLKLGPMPPEQKLVVVVFISTIVLWFTEKLPDFIANAIGWSGHGISSAVVALIGGLSLMIFRLLDEKDVSSGISWSSLLILGSGIALGGAMIDTGLSSFIAQQMSGLGMLPPFFVIIVIGCIAVLVTMVASNTGAAVILIPIAIPLATGLGIDPLLIVMVIAIAVSMDFALPTGTPPSTIAYSTGKVEMREMVTTGLFVDLIAILVVTIVVVWLWGLFGLVMI